VVEKRLKFEVKTRVADPHQFKADPDPSFHFDADLDTDPTVHIIRIRILLLAKVLQKCEHCSSGLHGFSLSHHVSIVSVHGPP
jgi:hypothetical protein